MFPSFCRCLCTVKENAFIKCSDFLKDDFFFFFFLDVNTIPSGLNEKNDPCECWHFKCERPTSLKSFSFMGCTYTASLPWQPERNIVVVVVNSSQSFLFFSKFQVGWRIFYLIYILVYMLFLQSQSRSVTV